VTSRERFRETMRYCKPDRVPYFEEGLRDDVLEAWRAQGLPEGVNPYDLFETDRRERIPVNIEPLGGYDRPAYDLTYRELRASLDPDRPDRFPDDWSQRVEEWSRREHVLELWLGRGFFLSMGVHDWPRFVDAVYLVKDNPARARGILRACGELAAAIADRVLDEVDVDMVMFSEPIGGNDRPLLSPDAYEEFVLESFRPAFDVLRARNVEVICLVTYANARALIASVLRYGLNCLWACEVNQEAMDYRDIRQQFGRELRLIGGIDLDVLSQGEQSIRREIEAKVPPLLAQGGYVPLADGRIRANVPFSAYSLYRRLLAQATRAL